MLKLKDNVDLKELEKYGFELDEYNKYALPIKIVIPCYCYSCENGNTNHNKEEIIKGLYMKKHIIKLIEWRKPFYKRIFCKHKYQGYNAIGLTNGEYHTEICNKCGKIKYNPIFWEYEGMGFK